MKYVITFFILILSYHVQAGAWGVGSFENDDALDWFFEVSSANTASVFFETFEETEGNGYLQVDTCSAAVAAADVVSSINSQSHSNLPDDVQAWVKKANFSISEDLKSAAKAAIKQCTNTDKSELAGLWLDAGPDVWEASIQSIMERLE